MTTQWLSLADHKLAYQQRRANKIRRFARFLAGRRKKMPGVFFLGGYGSDMTGTKASFLDACCGKEGFDYLRFDYRAHGQSPGAFTKGTIGQWFEDALAMFDQCTHGPQILVGSSMGGWLAFLIARARPERVAGIVGAAAAPDFTENLVLQALGEEQKETLYREGIIIIEGMPFTLSLIKEGRNHLILNQPFPALPVHLLQGEDDTEVPWQYALRVAQHVPSDRVAVTIVKEADHRLSRPQDLALLWRTVKGML